MATAYTEMGIGNPTFINTEIEHADGTETRQSGFVKFSKFESVYIRIWLGKRVYALGSKQGFNTKRKSRNAFKFLLGVSGIVSNTSSRKPKAK